MRTIVLCVFAVAISLQAATPEKGKTELRKLAKLPTVNLTMKVGMSTERGFALTEPASEVERRLAALQKRIAQEPRHGLLQLELHQLLTTLQRKAESEVALKRALELLRKDADARPGDASVVAGFAQALAESGERGTAERLLRAALARSTNEWRLWAELGSVLSDRAGAVLVYGEAEADSRRAPGDFIEAVLRRRPSAGDIQRTEQLLVEAERSFDRAAAVAPTMPEIYLQRARYKSLSGVFKTIVEELRKPEADVQRVFNAFFSRSALQDLQRAGELSPTNYLAIGTAAMLEALAGTFGKPSGSGPPDHEAMTLDRLLPKSRTAVRDAMTRLENLGEHPNRALAAGASELLGGLQFMVARDPDGATKSLRHAVDLDPMRHQAWDMLIGLIYMMEKKEALVAICADRVKALDSPRNRLLLAKAHDHAGNAGKAKEVIESALKTAPDDLALLLASAALQLRRAKTKDEIFAAGKLLAHVAEKTDTMPEAERATLALDGMLLSSIALALDDEPDAARAMVQKALQESPNDEHALKVLDALQF